MGHVLKGEADAYVNNIDPILGSKKSTYTNKQYLPTLLPLKIITIGVQM